MNSSKNQYPRKNTQAESAYSESSEKTSLSYADIAKDIGKQSFKIIGCLFFIALLFGFINVSFVVYDSFHLRLSDWRYIPIVLSLISTILFTFLALSATYRFAIVNLVGLVYKYLTPFFKRICMKIIDIIVSTSSKISGKDIQKSLNVGAVMIEIYGSRAPKYIQKGLTFVLNKIPFSDFLKEMHKDLCEKKDPITLSEILYKHLHCYLSRMFETNSMKFVLFILVLNIFTQILIVIFF